MSVGRESIRRAANAGAGKTVKKPVVSTKEAGYEYFQEKKLFFSKWYRRKEKNSKRFCSY